MIARLSDNNNWEVMLCLRILSPDEETGRLRSFWGQGRTDAVMYRISGTSWNLKEDVKSLGFYSFGAWEIDVRNQYIWGAAETLEAGKEAAACERRFYKLAEKRGHPECLRNRLILALEAMRVTHTRNLRDCAGDSDFETRWTKALPSQNVSRLLWQFQEELKEKFPEAFEPKAGSEVSA